MGADWAVWAPFCDAFVSFVFLCLCLSLSAVAFYLYTYMHIPMSMYIYVFVDPWVREFVDLSNCLSVGS